MSHRRASQRHAGRNTSRHASAVRCWRWNPLRKSATVVRNSASCDPALIRHPLHAPPPPTPRKCSLDPSQHGRVRAQPHRSRLWRLCATSCTRRPRTLSSRLRQISPRSKALRCAPCPRVRAHLRSQSLHGSHDATVVIVRGQQEAQPRPRPSCVGRRRGSSRNHKTRFRSANVRPRRRASCANPGQAQSAHLFFLGRPQSKMRVRLLHCSPTVRAARWWWRRGGHRARPRPASLRAAAPSVDYP